jgi:quinol-cytochrome oxidoreductase complex cytochrome b subunit
MPQDNSTLTQPSLFRRIGYSIFPGLARRSKNHRGYRQWFNSLVLHFRPRTVPERTLRFTLTWGLGGSAAVLVFLLFGTGLLLKFYYEPFPGRAYDSILWLQNEIMFGKLVRNIHHWSSNVLLIVAFLHFLRVFFTGAFHQPRQFNWIIGLALLLTIVLSNFTGYLLPWDQLAYWAITISIGMLEYLPFIGDTLRSFVLGGREIGPATLSNFYAIHTAVLPGCIVILMSFHFWRIRKAGGLVVPRESDENAEVSNKRVPTIPNLIIREVVVALVVIALILMIAVYFDAPLGNKANPGLSPNPTKAPWYFLGFQEMLMHIHPLFALFVIPVVILIGLASIPYIRYTDAATGVWFVSPTGRRMGLIAVFAAVIATPAGILVSEFLVDFPTWLPGVPTFVSNGLFPLILDLAGVWFFCWFLKRKYRATKSETVQMVFVFFVTAFVILTITGIWFRGTGMRLAWP